MHDAGPERSQLEHLVVADLRDLAGLRHDPRVGRVHAVDVGIDLADFRPDGGGESDGRGVRAAASQCGNSAIGRDTLEAGHDHDFPFIEMAADAAAVDGPDPSLGVGGVRHHSHLPAREADRLVPRGVDGHGHQRDGNLLARGQQHVQFPLGWVGADFFGQGKEFVRGMAHGGDDHHHLLARQLGLDGSPGSPVNLLRGGHAGPAKLLYDDAHGGEILPARPLEIQTPPVAATRLPVRRALHRIRAPAPLARVN